MQYFEWTLRLWTKCLWNSLKCYLNINLFDMKSWRRIIPYPPLLLSKQETGTSRHQQAANRHQLSALKQVSKTALFIRWTSGKLMEIFFGYLYPSFLYRVEHEQYIAKICMMGTVRSTSWGLDIFTQSQTYALRSSQ